MSAAGSYFRISLAPSSFQARETSDIVVWGSLSPEATH